MSKADEQRAWRAHTIYGQDDHSYAFTPEPAPGITVQFTLDDNARRPTKAYADDAAWDVYASRDERIMVGMVNVVHTGVHVHIPAGWYGQILTRSGYAKRGLFVVGGVIDSGYTGEIRVLVYNASTVGLDIHPGDRVAQLVLLPVPRVRWQEVDALPDTRRAANGFGSTGA